nr:MAG TPA: hypothetical protein [Caudoviricetes sp.]
MMKILWNNWRHFINFLFSIIKKTATPKNSGLIMFLSYKCSRSII